MLSAGTFFVSHVTFVSFFAIVPTIVELACYRGAPTELVRFGFPTYSNYKFLMRFRDHGPDFGDELL